MAEKDNAIVIAGPEGRFRFINIYTAKMNYGQTAMEHSVCCLIPKTVDLAVFEQAREKIAKAAFGKIPNNLRKIVGGTKPMMKDGDEVYNAAEDDKKEMYNEFRGCWVLQPAAPETDALTIYGPDKTVLMDPAELYDGCYGQLFIRMNCYPSKARKGYAGGNELSVSLKGLIKTRDGEPLSSATSTPLTDEDISRLLGGVAPGAAGPATKQEESIDDL